MGNTLWDIRLNEQFKTEQIIVSGRFGLTGPSSAQLIGNEIKRYRVKAMQT